MGRPIVFNKKLSSAHQGFTLIELLIVVIIIAMGAALVSVAVGGDHYQDEARKEAEEFLLTGNYLAEQAVFRGETYGGFFYPKDDQDGSPVWCYQWQRIRDSQWQPLEELPERCLPIEFEVEILIDGQPWAYDDSLEYHDPVIGFYPSGEGSAEVNLRFFREAFDQHEATEEVFLLTPMGELRWLTEEERLEQNQ
jgi:general secretion pathway protein H